MKSNRLDLVATALFQDFSRTRIQKFIKNGDLLLNGIHVFPKSKVAPGDEISLTPTPEISPLPDAENIPLEILFEDDQMIIINKAAGMVVHPAPGNYSGTLVNALLYHCKSTLSEGSELTRPGIVHRLDKGTSGVMVVAKTELAHQKLAEQFMNHSIERVYLALTWGCPDWDSGTIDKPIGRHPVHRKKMAVNPKGKHAITHWKKVDSFEDFALKFSLIEARLETGRTHQIRVHMKDAGFPLLGDDTYGKPEKQLKKLPQDLQNCLKNFKRPALHAKVLGVKHPLTEEVLRFEKQPPEDFTNLLKALRNVG